MAWDNAVVTNAGVAMYQQVLEGATLVIDYAAGGSGTVVPASLMAQTTLKSEIQSLPIVGLTNVANGKKVNILIVSKGLATGYTMNQIGIWAHVGNNPPTLYAILQDNTGLGIPSESEIPDFALNFFAVIDASNEAEFTLTVDTSALVSVGMMETALTEKLNADGNGSDVTATFTQAGERANISTGEKLSVIFGKIKKYFSDLGTAAFKNTGTGANDVATGNHSHSAVTTSTNGFMSSTDKSKLDGITAGAQVNTVNSVAGKTGAVTLNKSDVGLSNVNNTSDLDKPVSAAQQYALNSKVDLSSYTAIDVLNKVKTVDGSGSGLDADRLDGKEASDFATASQGALAESTDNLLKNGAKQSPQITWGMNRIQIPEIPTSPRIEFTGYKPYINMLWGIGNCESLTPWSVSNVTQVLDATQKKFGNYSIKMTLSYNNADAVVSAGSLAGYIKDKTKYYMFSAYIKNGNVTGGIGLSVVNNVNVTKKSPMVTDTTKFVRVCFTLTPADMASSTDPWDLNICIGNRKAGGLIGQYAYFDGIMINEIEPTDPNLPADLLMEKYPYVDGYGCLTNPYFGNRRYNILDNGNCEDGIEGWNQIESSSSPSLSVVGNKFRMVTTTLSIIARNVVVKPNTDYYLSGNAVVVSGANGAYIKPYTLSWDALRGTPGVFNTGSNSVIRIGMVLSGAGTADFDSIMLVEGTTPPSEYKSCEHREFVIEGMFTDRDNIIIENGEVKGTRGSAYSVLYGKDNYWTFFSDSAGYKTIKMPSPPGIAIAPVSILHTLMKYDGSLIPRTTSVTNGSNLYAVNATDFYITVPDADSGWTEGLNPTADEVRTFMNGWKAIYSNGIRYLAWVSILDKVRVPDIAIQAKISTMITDPYGEPYLTVQNGGTQFVAGDVVVVINPNGSIPGVWTVTGTPTATNIPLMNNANQVYEGAIVMKVDNGTTNTMLRDWCKSNVAPNYKGYHLHYQLNNPEPVSDANVHVKGEIWDLVKGDNYIIVDSGIVLGEVVNPVLYGNYYYLNIDGSAYSYVQGSEFQNKVESILNLYNNRVKEGWGRGNVNANGYGNVWFSRLKEVHDTNAVYTADYQILKTLHAQLFGSLSLSYKEGILATLEGHSKTLEQKQSKNIVLDNYIDLSMYEELIDVHEYSPWVHTVSKLYIKCTIKFSVLKKVVPTISIKALRITAYAGTVSSSIVNDKFTLDALDVYRDRCSLMWVTTDANVITNIKANGCAVKISLVADSKGRV